MDEMRKGISRRKFLASGTVAVGACSLAAGMTAGALIAPSKAQAEELAFPVYELDVERVRVYGYLEYFNNGGCGQGGGRGLILGFIEAAEAHGLYDTGWHQLPKLMTAWGGGGGNAWGGTCGSLSGALQALAMAGLHGAVGNQVIDYYTKASFPQSWDGVEIPADIAAKYTTVPTPIAAADVAGQSVPESMLCHNSVSKWMAEAGVDLTTVGPTGVKVKLDRCSKVTGDTAAYAAEMVNLYLAEQALPAVTVPEEYADCLGCHGGVDIQGKQNCTPCHTKDGAVIVGDRHGTGGGGCGGKK